MEELELTYLVKELPDLKSVPSKEMLDIYLPSTQEHCHLRIRKIGEKLEITKKEPVTGTDSSHQLEITIPLTSAEYAELSTLPGKRVGKTRYYYTEAGVDHEIDIFTGDLHGLVLVDVEFDTKENKSAFAKPSWCLAEVTQEKFLAGGMLAGRKYEDIESRLETFG